jgi:hypothetical protein
MKRFLIMVVGALGVALTVLPAARADMRCVHPNTECGGGVGQAPHEAAEVTLREAQGNP